MSPALHKGHGVMVKAIINELKNQSNGKGDNKHRYFYNCVDVKYIICTYAGNTDTIFMMEVFDTTLF